MGEGVAWERGYGEGGYKEGGAWGRGVYGEEDGRGK